MTLRKAELKDYAQYCALYADAEQILYMSDESGEESITDEEIQSIIEKLPVDLDFINSLYDLSQEEYERMLMSKKIFLLEDDNSQIIGYISAILIKRNSYRIDELAMIYRECDTLVLQTIIADLVSKIPSAKEISFLPSNKKVKEMLEILGFEKDRGGIYSKRT